MNRYYVRADSFKSWRSSTAPNIDIASLAMAGFFYGGHPGNVQCFNCRRIFGNWVDGMDPMRLHWERAPECEYIKALYKVSTGDNKTDSSELSREENLIDTGISTESNGETVEMLTEGGNIQITQSALGDDLNDGDGPVELEENAADIPVEEVNNVSSISWGKQPTTRNKTLLKAENATMKRAVICKRCNVAPIETLFLPCRHLVSCEACSEAVENCILCNATILGTVRTYYG